MLKRSYAIPILNRLIGLAAIALCITLSDFACVAQRQLNPQADYSSQSPAAFAGLPSVSRLASASGDFLPYQDGAAYAVDLANNRCAAAGTFGQFTPNYAGTQDPLSSAAYGLYRLELDPAAASATLTLAWNGTAPASTECWVGLANWGRGDWDWLPLTTSTIEISSPSSYGDAAKHCYAALMVLGTTPVELASISFGPLPPSSNGYTLFQPMSNGDTYLIDDKGTVAHSWLDTAGDNHTPGASAWLDEAGFLWRQVHVFNQVFQQVGGAGGLLEKVDWAGNVVWSYKLSSPTQCTHHDFVLMPNGNVLLTVWNKLTKTQAIDAGHDPATLSLAGLLVDSIMEIKPTGTDGADIVWQWFGTDHLVQDFASDKANYGDPAAHPELIDFNYTTTQNFDWTHVNCIDYNPDLDQIAISPLFISEAWVIDHSTTTAEAAGHSGGKYGRGGDLLYRWGNPQAYRAGTSADQLLHLQHDVHWIKPGLPGAGDLLIFNNHAGTGPNYSAIVEITTPLNPDGSYFMTGAVYGPAVPTWQYVADPPGDFYAMNMSNSQRLPDGNTLISDAPAGYMFEVTSAGEKVWEYRNILSTPAMIFRALRYPSDYPGLANLP